jgi:hypothetical protein
MLPRCRRMDPFLPVRAMFTALTDGTRCLLQQARDVRAMDQRRQFGVVVDQGAIVAAGMIFTVLI